MIEEVATRLYKITTTVANSPLRTLNAYLFKGEDTNLLVDNGFSTAECFENLMTGLKKLSVSLEQTDFFLTHRHTDHCGLTHKLAALSSTQAAPRILTSHEEATAIISFFEGNFMWRLHAMAAHGFPLESSLRLFGSPPKPEDVVPYPFAFTYVEDGDILEYAGYRMEVLKVPGHTPSQVTLYLPEEQIYLAGDHILGSISPNITSWNDGHDSLGRYLKSLERVLSYPITLTLTGHRECLSLTHQRIEELIRHHQERLEEVLAILQAHPAATAYMVARHMQWRIRARSWDEFPLLQQWFATGEALAHLEHLEQLGKVQEKTNSGLVFFELCS